MGCLVELLQLGPFQHESRIPNHFSVLLLDHFPIPLICCSHSTGVTIKAWTLRPALQSVSQPVIHQTW